MLRTFRHFLELIRFSHTIFALPFALLAAMMAWRLRALQGSPRLEHVNGKDTIITDLSQNTFQMMESQTTIGGHTFDTTWYFAPWFNIRWQELFGILLCMITARSFAMAANRLADRKLDAANPRTAGRHLPAGILSIASVSLFVAASAIGFIASTLLFLPNRLPLYLAVPVLAFLAGYSYAKRFTSFAHFWLGAALALSPVAAWIAIRGDAVLAHPIDLLPALVLGGAVLTWVAGFDVIYACQDYDADTRAGLHSVPVRLGVSGALRLAAACHVATITLLVGLPLVYPPLGWIYWAGIGAVAVLLIYEHSLVRPDDLSRVNLAFFRVNAVISLGLFAVATLDLLLGHG